MMSMSRTTITLDDDLLRRLKLEMRRSGKSFKDMVNETVRQGLSSRRSRTKLRPFKIKGMRDLGSFPGLDYDNIGKLTEYAEGPTHK